VGTAGWSGWADGLRSRRGWRVTRARAGGAVDPGDAVGASHDCSVQFPRSAAAGPPATSQDSERSTMGRAGGRRSETPVPRARWSLGAGDRVEWGCIGHARQSLLVVQTRPQRASTTAPPRGHATLGGDRSGEPFGRSPTRWSPWGSITVKSSRVEPAVHDGRAQRGGQGLTSGVCPAYPAIVLQGVPRAVRKSASTPPPLAVSWPSSRSNTDRGVGVFGPPPRGGVSAVSSDDPGVRVHQRRTQGLNSRLAPRPGPCGRGGLGSTVRSPVARATRPRDPPPPIGFNQKPRQADVFGRRSAPAKPPHPHTSGRSRHGSAP